jgi:hypothetical protein
VRDYDECLARVDASPGSVAIIQWRPELAERISQLLWQIERFRSQSRSVVVCEQGSEPYRPLAFEAGARMFIGSPRNIGAVARFIRRHLAIYAAEGGAEWGDVRHTVGDDHEVGDEHEAAAVIGDLFDELAENNGELAVQRSIARLASRLPKRI